MMTKILKTKLLDDRYVPEIVDVLCDSFFEYPVMRFVIDSETDYNHKLKMLINFFVMARILRKEPIIGVGDRAKLEGVALISFPDNSIYSQVLKDLRDQLWSKLGIQSRSNYQKFSDVSSQFQIEVSHVHLNMLGVRRSAQGSGLGRKLIEQVELYSSNHPTSGGVTLTTEDPNKVSFYEYLGYSIIGEAMVTPQLKTWGFYKSI